MATVINIPEVLHRYSNCPSGLCIGLIITLVGFESFPQKYFYAEAEVEQPRRHYTVVVVCV